MTRTFAEALAQLCPNASKTIIAGIVDNLHLLDHAGINTPIRVRHFFARVCVETGGLHAIEENLNYSARRAHEVWPGRFPTAASAKPFANNPVKLAEKVYGGRGTFDKKVVQRVIDQGQQAGYTFPETVKLYVTYRTVSVAANGAPVFRDDVYGRDKRVVREMEKPRS